jgi:hypothetical protein
VGREMRWTLLPGVTLARRRGEAQAGWRAGAGGGDVQAGWRASAGDVEARAMVLIHFLDSTTSDSQNLDDNLDCLGSWKF